MSREKYTIRVIMLQYIQYNFEKTQNIVILALAITQSVCYTVIAKSKIWPLKIWGYIRWPEGEQELL